jgi:hypothetical protein
VCDGRGDALHRGEDEEAAVMRRSGDDRHGFRLRALIVVLWRGGPRVQEALALGGATRPTARVAARPQWQARPTP